jgi:hypothetical protein
MPDLSKEDLEIKVLSVIYNSEWVTIGLEEGDLYGSAFAEDGRR